MSPKSTKGRLSAAPLLEEIGKNIPQKSRKTRSRLTDRLVSKKKKPGAVPNQHKLGKHQKPQPVHAPAIGSSGRGDPDNFVPTPGSPSLEALQSYKYRKFG